MRRVLGFLASLAAVLAFLAPAAVADTQSKVLFSHKNWEVSVVSYDDGSVFCVAQVYDETDSFAIWANSTDAVQLQFYSEAWDFGEGQTANLQVRIDRRTPWTLTGANLHLQSVLFNIYDSDEGVRFMREVMRGNVLSLFTENGQHVLDYSLAGSSASITALIDCANALNRPSNPFQ